jgi:hypothetical protein
MIGDYILQVNRAMQTMACTSVSYHTGEKIKTLLENYEIGMSSIAPNQDLRERQEEIERNIITILDNFRNSSLLSCKRIQLPNVFFNRTIPQFHMIFPQFIERIRTSLQTPIHIKCCGNFPTIDNQPPTLSFLPERVFQATHHILEELRFEIPLTDTLSIREETNKFLVSSGTLTVPWLDGQRIKEAKFSVSMQSIPTYISPVAVTLNTEYQSVPESIKRGFHLCSEQTCSKGNEGLPYHCGAKVAHGETFTLTASSGYTLIAHSSRVDWSQGSQSFRSLGSNSTSATYRAETSPDSGRVEGALLGTQRRTIRYSFPIATPNLRLDSAAVTCTDPNTISWSFSVHDLEDHPYTYQTGRPLDQSRHLKVEEVKNGVSIQAQFPKELL